MCQREGRERERVSAFKEVHIINRAYDWLNLIHQRERERDVYHFNIHARCLIII